MATSETLVWYDAHRQRFISPMTANAALQTLINGVPADELHAASLDYLPERAPANNAPLYAGVCREHTLTYESHALRLRVLVVYSRTKAKLDAEKHKPGWTSCADALPPFKVI